jgi:hypothetical protein
MAGFEGFGLFDPDLQDETGGGEEDDIFLSAAEILDKVREHSKSGQNEMFGRTSIFSSCN